VARAIALWPELVILTEPVADVSAQRAPMAIEEEWNEFIAASARALALPVEPGWYPAVRSNLVVIWKLAALVAEFELPDDAEPAPLFWA
jgi:hypothetical protein